MLPVLLPATATAAATGTSIGAATHHYDHDAQVIPENTMRFPKDSHAAGVIAGAAGLICAPLFWEGNSGPG